MLTCYFSLGLRSLSPLLALHKPISVPSSSFESALELLKASFLDIIALALRPQTNPPPITAPDGEDQGEGEASGAVAARLQLDDVTLPEDPRAAREELRALMFRGTHPRLQAELDYLLEQLRNAFFPWVHCARCGRWRRLPSWAYLAEVRAEGRLEGWTCDTHPRRRIPCRLQQEPWRSELYKDADPSQPLRGAEVLEAQGRAALLMLAGGDLGLEGATDSDAEESDEHQAQDDGTAAEPDHMQA